MSPLVLILTALASPADPAELLEEARHRALRGDYEGTRIVLAEALRVPGDHHLQARYLDALAWEYDGDLTRALQLYDEMLQDWPEDLSADDVLFRRAETLGRLGRFREADRQLRALDGERPASDQLKIDLLHGIWHLEAGKQRRGLNEVTVALADVEPDQAPWHQAQARLALIRVLVDSARPIPMRGSDRKKQRRLTSRTAFVRAAEDQLSAMIPLDATPHTLDGLLLVGAAYMDFGQAMRDEPELRRLNPLERTYYRSELNKRIEVVWIKGGLFFDRGLQYAASTGWQGPQVEELDAAHTDSQERIESL